MSLYLGIDTSNYTTSVASCGSDERDIRKIIDIKDGMRGIRQSDGVFVHLKTLPELYSQLDIDFSKVRAVGVSTRPRNVDGSYMPVFLAGESYAKVISETLGVPLYSFSHQDGHIMAALYSSGALHLLDCEQFAAFHVSGGTTELLLVNPKEDGMKIELIGGTQDMNAGQAIDRTGVMMGLKFPCGREMEALCGDVPYKKCKVSVNGLECNLSGLENLAAKKYRETEDKAATSAFCFDFIADTLYKLTENLREQYENIPVIFAGGVMSNKRIAKRLSALGNVYFSEPEFSADNAAGIALVTRRKYLENKL
jgi:N6-L-threonylcarbamoyladenine synthase